MRQRRRGVRTVGSKVAAVLGFGLSATSLFGAFHGVTVGGSLEGTLQSNGEIHSAFSRAHEIVAVHLSHNGTLPSPSEFESLAEKNSSERDRLRYIRLSYSPGANTAAASLGPMPAGTYLLSYWRGEWMEYSAGWRHASTVPLTKSEYFAFESRRSDIVIFTTISVLVGYLSALAWRRENYA